MAEEMRAVMAGLLKDEMSKNEKVIVIDSDLAKACGTFNLRKDFPDRALDVGIAEANMTSIAAGLTTLGATVFIFSFTPFVSRRACDQAAISVTYAGRNVKIVGTDPGLTAEINGGTHMSVEDIAVMRGIPNMVIFDPVDPVQLRKAFPQILAYDGPMYIRLCRKSVEPVFDESCSFDLFKAQKIKDGKDLTIFASSIMVAESAKAVEILEAEGISVDFINIHTIKPLDEEAVIASAKKTGAVLTCENSSVVGGLGSAVAEVLVKNAPVPMEMIGIQDRFGQVGKLPFLKEEYNMTAEDIAKAARKLLARK